MRHALITVDLVREARTAATTEAQERQSRTPLPDLVDEPKPETQVHRSRRLATLARRARALVARTT
jgi:hypothetical protein